MNITGKRILKKTTISIFLKKEKRTIQAMCISKTLLEFLHNREIKICQTLYKFLYIVPLKALNVHEKSVKTNIRVQAFCY